MINKDIERAVSHLKTARANCLKFVQNLTHSQLTAVPNGFNNSIYWNVAHLVVTQQLLQYKLSGLPTYLSEEFINDFCKGSTPKANYSEENWRNVVALFSSLPDKLLTDYENGKFKTFNEYQSSFGITLRSVEDAIAFNNIHEGLHVGYIMALKRAL